MRRMTGKQTRRLHVVFVLLKQSDGGLNVHSSHKLEPYTRISHTRTVGTRLHSHKDARIQDSLDPQGQLLTERYHGDAIHCRWGLQ